MTAIWKLFAGMAVDIVCESPVIVSFFTKDGRWAACLDMTGTNLTSEEQEELLQAIKAMPTYIGQDSIARGMQDDFDDF